MIWVASALVAALLQTIRNALQRSLTGDLGIGGATLVRFLYGLPFGVLFAGAAITVTGVVPHPGLNWLGWTATGAAAQALATALMLAAMRERSLVVVTVYTKTELLQTAILGAALLGDAVGPRLAIAVFGASLGVLLVSWPGARARDLVAWRPAVFGLLAGLIFALAAVGYRGGVMAFGEAPTVVRAASTLAAALAMQALVVGLVVAVRNPAALAAVVRLWRRSLGAGAAGAGASLFWFVAFAFTSAANVKLVGFAEVLFAGILSRRWFGEGIAPREAVGIALILGAMALAA